MKLFHLFFFSALSGISAFAANPRIGGAWVELRKAPVFEAPREKLAETWGSALPVGNEFEIEKVYGRWLYGKPAPIRYMRPKDYADAGWVYSRMLLMPDDNSTTSASATEETRLAIYYSAQAWKRLGLSASEDTLTTLNFLESLVLSQKTLRAFRSLDEKPAARKLRELQFFPEAFAEEAPQDPLGLVGADLSFLKQEFHAVQAEKKIAKKIRLSKTLRPPRLKPLTTAIKNDVLGRYLLYKYFLLPKLSHEEVDGTIYMRAVVTRALEGCPEKIQKAWSNRHWAVLRVLQLKAEQDEKNPWLQLSLPGNYFPVSARAIDLATNEAELAFLLVRPLVRAARIPAKPEHYKKNWPKELETLSEEAWLGVLKSQSTKDSDKLDVSDEIAVDQDATECISRAGYAPRSAISYLNRLSVEHEQPWAKWIAKHLIGLDYRVERLGKTLPNSLSKQDFPEGNTTNRHRFSQAMKYWNMLQ